MSAARRQPPDPHGCLGGLIAMLMMACVLSALLLLFVTIVKAF